MADVAFGHRAARLSPSATMNHPSQWHYVATWLMAHMGTNSSDEMKGLQWLRHQRAALRVRAAMRRHNIWPIPGSPGSQGHASGTGDHGPKRSRSPQGKRHPMTPREL